MNPDDLIYVLLLFFCIGFGHFFNKISNDQLRKNAGTFIGIFIVFVVSNVHFLHSIITFGLGTAILFIVPVKKCHLVSFVVLFSYLLFFRTTWYFGISKPPGHTNMIQMILTLKLVGIAFEKNNAYLKKKEIESSKDETKDLVKLTAGEEELLNLNVIDVLHYSFCYIGVLTGPYFSYKTFRDYWNLPFYKHANCFGETFNKMKWVPLFAGLYLSVSHFWPLDYATESEFYEQRSLLYRLWYVWPSFFIFRLRIYAGLTLSECVCTMAGFGAYPKESGSRPGGGPSKEYLHLSKTPEKVEYDFETIHNIDPYTTDTCITFREAMKSWNMCIQYWLAMNIYKRFPSKKYRTMATLAVSAFWHGVYPGYYFCMLGPPFYLPIEDIYVKLFSEKATGIMKTFYNIVCWISKFFAFSYMGIAFLLMTMDKCWFYYCSVYHMGYIIWGLMYAVGLMIKNQRKVAAKRLAGKGERAEAEKKET